MTTCEDDLMNDEKDWVELTGEPLDAGRAVAFVSDGSAGGIAVFLGTTRGARSADGRELVALDYEAYAEMAIAQMRKLSQAARGKWPIVKAAVLHRTGRVEIGQPSVVIAVSTPHRAEAFEACRFVIDELKREVTIWKKEVWADGRGTWVHPES
jgi:molybdopterin synthase catalytic subunit